MSRYRKIVVVACKTQDHATLLASTPQTVEEAEQVAIFYVHDPELETDDPSAKEQFNSLPGTYSDEDVDAFARELGIEIPVEDG